MVTPNELSAIQKFDHLLENIIKLDYDLNCQKLPGIEVTELNKFLGDYLVDLKQFTYWIPTHDYTRTYKLDKITYILSRHDEFMHHTSHSILTEAANVAAMPETELYTESGESRLMLLLTMLSLIRDLCDKQGPFGTIGILKGTTRIVILEDYANIPIRNDLVHGINYHHQPTTSFSLHIIDSSGRIYDESEVSIDVLHKIRSVMRDITDDSVHISHDIIDEMVTYKIDYYNDLL